MAIPPTLVDREQDKFIESTSTPNETAVKVVNPDGSNISGGGGGGGTEYTEGAVDTTITGTAIMWEDAGDTLEPVSASTPLPVNIVAGSGSGTEFNEDDPHTTGDAGTQALAVRRDADTSLVDADGDYAPLQVNAAGQLKTEVVESALPSGAATEATLSSIDGKDFATQTTLAAVEADTSSIDGKITACDTGNVTVSASALPTGAATAANQLPDGHNVIVDNGAGVSAVNIQDGGNIISVDDGGGTLSVDGTVAATQSGTWNITDVTGTVSLPTGAATAANQLPDGHNVTVSNVAGTNPVPIEGNVAAGAAISGANPVVVGFQNVSGNNVVPTGIAAGAFTVLGTVLVDTTGSPVTVTNAGAQITGDEAHDAADAGNPIKIGGKVETDAAGPTAVADADRVDAWFSSKGQLHVKNHSHFSGGTTLTALNDVYDDVTTSANSADISNDVGYRFADLFFTLESTSTPTRIQFIIQGKSGSNYFDAGFGYMQSILYEDTEFSTAQNRWLHFPIPATDNFRVRVVATGTTSTATFEITNAEIFLRT